MNEILAHWAQGLHLGRLKSRGLLGLVPIFQPSSGEPDYLAFEEAVERQTLTVTEIMDGGGVPRFKVVNLGEQPVLMLAGEMLSVGKEKRAVKGTILVPERSQCAVPVTRIMCGRWHATTLEFMDTGADKALKIAKRMGQAAVGYFGEGKLEDMDPERVWDGGGYGLAYAGGDRSRNADMLHVYLEKLDELFKLKEGFSCAKGQKGLIALIHGEVAGIEYLSSPKLFRSLFPTLAHYYALQALSERGGKGQVASVAKARVFLECLGFCNVSRCRGVGCGESMRFEADGVAGSGLADEGRIIHIAGTRIHQQNEKVKIKKEKMRNGSGKE